MKITKIIGIALSLILVFALALSITACKEDNKTDDPQPNEDSEITGVSFTDKTVTYNGQEQKIEVTGTLPEGVSVSYFGNVGTNAGVYNATATLSGEGYQTKILNATLTVEKANITGVSAENLTVTYDGTEKTLQLVGELPEGVSVTATHNIATNAGEYTATFTLRGENYNEKIITAKLTINKADIVGITLPSRTFTEDGSEKSLEIEGTLPEGVSVEYVGNGVSAIGNHPVTAIISGANYNTLELNSFIVIEAAPLPEDKEITGVELNPAEFTYDGTAKSLEIEGTLPEGVSVEYVGNGKINAGKYTVTATLSGEGYITAFLTAELTINKATLTGIELNDERKPYQEGIYHKLLIVGELPEGVTVTYTYNGASVESVNKSGTYTVIATVSAENYETLVLTATLEVFASQDGGIVTPEHKFD
ncbi:MAG: hypothetical protein IKL79_05870 [Clostridia bacterium]|nr:hypothetical protein [Clostridia bacterium]